MRILIFRYATKAAGGLLYTCSTSVPFDSWHYKSERSVTMMNTSRFYSTLKYVSNSPKAIAEFTKLHQSILVNSAAPKLLCAEFTCHRYPRWPECINFVKSWSIFTNYTLNESQNIIDSFLNKYGIHLHSKLQNLPFCSRTYHLTADLIKVNVR